MTNIWCLIAYAAIIYDFAYDHILGEFLASIMVIYISLLVIFVGVKEFERWSEVRQGRHPGELFVIGWTLLMACLVAAKIIFNKTNPIPEEVLSTYIAVLSIMAITQKSKKLKARKKEEERKK